MYKEGQISSETPENNNEKNPSPKLSKAIKMIQAALLGMAAVFGGSAVAEDAEKPIKETTPAAVAETEKDRT